MTTERIIDRCEFGCDREATIVVAVPFAEGNDVDYQGSCRCCFPSAEDWRYWLIRQPEDRVVTTIGD